MKLRYIAVGLILLSLVYYKSLKDFDYILVGDVDNKNDVS
ncbi:hypothetical protein BRC2024_KCUCJSVR_CDS_0075 [Acinetobacter phage vB_AbaM_KissB]|nr:hypothetical protein BJD49_gp081 [Acinetobacter phage vB_AbaM_phiAbaA1]AJK27209.1 hypothetical protein phiAbaA1_106 [Acinetobacter phage vB_AbaM_phiAbaA1]